MVTSPDLTSGPATKSRPLVGVAPPRIVPRRHVGRWLTAAFALLLFAMALDSVVRNEAFQWAVVGRYFTSAATLGGLLLSLWLTAVVMVLGFLFGTVLAVMRLSANPVLRMPSWGYVWIFRSTPLLVQLLFWFNIGALYPTVGLGVPFDPQFLTVKTYQVIPLLMVATLWYIAVTTVLGAGQFYVDRYYARGNSRTLPPTPPQRLRGQLAAGRLRLSAATAAAARPAIDARPTVGGDR
jgi:polar amino acid transport system permease protein